MKALKITLILLGAAVVLRVSAEYAWQAYQQYKNNKRISQMFDDDHYAV